MKKEGRRGRKGWRRPRNNTHLEEQLGDVLDLNFLLVEQEESALVCLVHQLLGLLVHGLRRVFAVRPLFHAEAALLSQEEGKRGKRGRAGSSR